MNLLTYLTQEQKQDLLNSPLSPEHALALAAKTIMFDYLLQNGGMRKQMLVWNQQIQHLHLPELAGQVNLDLGEKASHLLQTLENAFTNDQCLRLPTPDRSNGEIFFFHALYLFLRKDRHPPRFLTALRHASPLSRLCSCPSLGKGQMIQFEDGETGECVLTHEENIALLKHPVTRYLCGDLADRWSSALLPDPHKDPASQVERLNTKRATLLQLMRSCAETGTLSLLVSFLLFFQRLIQYDLANRASRILSFSKWRVVDREKLLSAYIGIFHLGVQFEEIYQREIVHPGSYGWEHPLETKVLMAKYGKYWSTGGLKEAITQHYEQLRSQMG